MEQTVYLNKLASISNNYPIKVSDYWKNEDGVWTPGKWKLYSPTNMSHTYDLRSVLPNEVVFDLDDKVWKKNRKYANTILKFLKSKEIPYYAFLSGGKGIHISVFTCLTENEQVQQAIDKGYNWNAIRNYLHRKIVEDSGLTYDINLFDIRKVNFDDVSSKGSIIRVCGGRCKKKEENTFKIYLPTGEFPERKDIIKDSSNITYPETIEQWKIPGEWIDDSIRQFLYQRKRIQKVNNEYNPDFKYEGKYLQLECVQNIISRGCLEGSRNSGAYVVTVACLKDGLSDGDNCENSFSFSENEAYSWMNWLKDKPKIYFSHTKSKQLGRCSNNCGFHQLKFKKVYDFLKKPDLLIEIIKVISRDFNNVAKKVVFEEDNLRIIYLVCLSALTSDPLNLKVVGASSDGKTAMVTPVIAYFPKHMIWPLQSMSKKSLYYTYDEILYDGTRVVDINGKVIVLLEETTSIDFLGEIKALLSHDYPEVEVKTVIEHRLVKTIIRGWPAYIGLSVTNSREEELETREIIISPVSTKKKFQAVITENAKANCFTKNFKSEYDTEVKQIPDVLEKIDVYNPYKVEIAKLFPKEKGSDMRHWKKFNSLIDTHTFLHQKQRKIVSHNNQEVVISELEDVLSVLKFFADGLRSTITGINRNVKRFWDEVIIDNKEEFELYNNIDNPIYKKDILRVYERVNGNNITNYYLNDILNVLENKGLLTREKTGKGDIFTFNFDLNVDDEIDELIEKITQISRKSNEEIEREIKDISY